MLLFLRSVDSCTILSNAHSGVYVSSVSLECLEDRLQVGDQILQVNGQSVGEYESHDIKIHAAFQLSDI